MIDRALAREAADLISGERNEQYGPPEDGLLRVARLWSAYLSTAVTVADVAKMMALLKIGRTMGDYKRDNYVDGIAYLLIAEGVENGCSKP